MSKAAIPSVKTGQADLDNALQAIKQNMDAITGQARNNPTLSPLPTSATLVQVVTQLNAVLARIQ